MQQEFSQKILLLDFNFQTLKIFFSKITKTYPWRLDLSKLDWEPKGDLKADIEPVCWSLRWTAWPLGVPGPGDPSRKSEEDPHFLVRLKFDNDPLRFLGWVPEGIMGPPPVWDTGTEPADNFWPLCPTPFRCVGEGLGAGLIELEEWLSECKDPVDWYIVDLKKGIFFSLFSFRPVIMRVTC